MTLFKCLSFKNLDLLQALAFVLLEDVHTRFPEFFKLRFKEKISSVYSHHSFQIRLMIRIFIFCFQWSALVKQGKFFTSLPFAKQKKHYLSWFSSSSLLVYLLIRPVIVLIYSCFYNELSVSESLGFQDIPDASTPPDLPLSFDFTQDRRRGGEQKGILDIPDHATQVEVEICVIGSGAGGAVVAKELAEKGHEVLILEEGGYFSKDYFKTHSTFTRDTQIYRDAGLTATLGKPFILVPTGKCVGGTTVINSGTCFRTPDSILKKWQQEYGLTHLTSDFLKPYFEKVEQTLQVQVVTDNLLGGNNQMIRQGVNQLRFIGKSLMRNVNDCQGSGVCIFGCPTGAKQSMERSYLPLAFKAGATLYPYCHVKKIRTREGKAQVIEAFFTNHLGKKVGELKVYAKKVVVACGTFNTPLLLKKSGMGKQSGELGKNLSIHPTGKIVGIFDETIDGFKGVPQGYSILDDEGEGIMYESVFFPPWLLATSLYQVPKIHREIMEAYRHLVIFGFLVHDQSRGRVVAGLDGRPLIFYHLGKKELELYKKGMQRLMKVFFAAGAKKIFPSIKHMSPLEKPEDVSKINWSQIKAKDLESAAFHPLGTARMGSDPKRSVVNEDLRIHDLENVWVVDGSVFPTSLGVNPQITIMAFATRAAENIGGA